MTKDSDGIASALPRLRERLARVRHREPRLRLSRRLPAVAAVLRPDLDDDASSVDADNLLALAVIYYAAQLEEAQLFEVTDQIAERFAAGAILLSEGSGRDLLAGYLRDEPRRPTRDERRLVYARALDGDDSDGSFDALWLRALVEVCALARRPEADPAQAAKSLRALAQLLSRRGGGVTHSVIGDLVAALRASEAVAANPEVLAAFGASDPSELLQRVAERELGAAVDTRRAWTMAEAGAEVILWLADHTSTLAGDAPLDRERLSEAKLVDNAARWLSLAPLDGADR